MNKAIKYSYFTVLFLSIVFMTVAVIFGSNTTVSHVEATKTLLVEPSEAHLLDDNIIEYQLDLEHVKDDVSMALQFFTSHQNIQVYVGEELIYSVLGGASIFGHTTGSGINIVLLPVETTTVRVVMESVFGSAKEGQEFYYGDAVSLYRATIKASLPDVILSGLIVAFGIGMIFYWIIVHRRLGKNPAVLYFGLFATMIGLWALNETDMIRLIFTKRSIASMMAYMMLALLIVPFVQFVRYFFEKEHSKLCDMICAITILETILLFVMHITNIWEFRQSAWMIHGLMFVALWYMAFCVRERIHQYGADRKVKINAIAVGALAVSIVVDMIAFYMDVQRTDVLGKIGILIYILLLGKECYADAFAKIQEGEKAESYLQLAMTDVMTGLMNRSAFEEWEDKCTDLSDVMIVTFDLNNLKYCNDHLGHKAGDEYIIEAANMISRVFGAVGQCYRIGGDEFCAVILKASHFNIEKYLDRLREEQDYFNRESEQVKIHIAVGYALHENCDEDMEQTRSRADAFMYRNKNKMKINGER